VGRAEELLDVVEELVLVVVERLLAGAHAAAAHQPPGRIVGGGGLPLRRAARLFGRGRGGARRTRGPLPSPERPEEAEQAAARLRRTLRLGRRGLKHSTLTGTGSPPAPAIRTVPLALPAGALLQSTLTQTRSSFPTGPADWLSTIQGSAAEAVNSNRVLPRLKTSM